MKETDSYRIVFWPIKLGKSLISSSVLWVRRVVQPYGRDKARESTVISEHTTAADAFAEIDRLSAPMVRTGAPSDAVELIVVDGTGRIVQRPEAH